MIKNFVSFALCILLTFPAFADCDFKKDIKEDSSGNFIYTKECHIEAGKAVKSAPLLNEKIVNLEKKIELKDMMLEKQEERVRLWLDTSSETYNTLMKYESFRAKDNAMYFALGIGVAVISVFVAKNAIK